MRGFQGRGSGFGYRKYLFEPLLEHYLKQLRWPTMVREFPKLGEQCAKEGATLVSDAISRAGDAGRRAACDRAALFDRRYAVSGKRG